MSASKIAQSRYGTGVAVSVIMISFAANSLITRYLVLGNYLTPFALTVIRFLSGFLALAIITISFPKVFQRSKVCLSDLWGGIFLGVYAFAISYGYAFISAGAGALVFYSFVVLTMSSYSVIIDKEKLTSRLVCGTVLGIAGILVITFSHQSIVSPLGVLLMAITGTSWGLYSVYGRRFQSYFGYTFNSFMIFGGIAILLILLTYPLLGANQWVNVHLNDLGLALYLGMISTALSYILWNRVLKRLKASQGGLAQLLVPILTSIMGIVFLSEKVTSALVIGGALILFGIYVSAFRKPNAFKAESASKGSERFLGESYNSAEWLGGQGES
jgi:drug/metabolite transporter (DMT)-like permease